jgi:N-acetylglucosamine malate deacetylase 1
LSIIRTDERNQVLCIAVHPDDETLGCGGTLARHRRNGDSIHWLILTCLDGAQGYTAEQIGGRQKEIQEVANLYGFSTVSSLDYPCARLDTIAMSELVQRIHAVVEQIKPEVVYLPNRSDAHSDHRVAFEAIGGATKSFRCPFIQRMLSYECLSETEMAPALAETAFVPTVFVDITEGISVKQKAMQLYPSELMAPSFPRSLEIMEALARFRGSRIGVPYAESFMLLYEAIRA